MRNPWIRLALFISIAFASLLITLENWRGDGVPPVSAARLPVASQNVYLPFVRQSGSGTFAQTRRVNAPNFNNDAFTNHPGEEAIFWFGQVTPTENYSDVRVGYNNTELFIRLNVFDRRIWYDTNPSNGSLAAWDAIVLNLDLNGNIGNQPTATSFRFVAQFSHWEDRSTGSWQGAFRGNSGNWLSITVPFTTESFYRGDGGPNRDLDNRGWTLTFYIPFSSLGLAGPPPQGTIWGLGTTLYDRDDAAGTFIPTKVWPETMNGDQPSTWGQLHIGLPAVTIPSKPPSGTVTLKNGVNSQIVKDGSVGGAGVCGDPALPDFFSRWGSLVYAGWDQLNIQNQADVADWPCFAKYYITFPLDALPSGKTIISATLTVQQFGNAGVGEPRPPIASLIQVHTVAEDWDANTLSWNTAPLAAENVAATWADIIPSDPGSAGVPRIWDVTRAIAQAYTARKPARFVLYSSDYQIHSGKYFYSSYWYDPAGRPSLTITWGE